MKTNIVLTISINPNDASYFMQIKKRYKEVGKQVSVLFAEMVKLHRENNPDYQVENIQDSENEKQME